MKVDGIKSTWRYISLENKMEHFCLTLKVSGGIFRRQISMERGRKLKEFLPHDRYSSLIMGTN